MTKVSFWQRTMFLTIAWLGLALLLPHFTQAVCPLCTIAVGAGLGFSRYLGIDDTITGVWIGGLIISSSLWMVSFAQNHHWWKWLTNKWIDIAIFFLLVLPPLYWSKIIGHPANTVWGIDKVILGTAVGAMGFLGSVKLDTWLRSKNNGHVYIYYQKVIIPVLMLTLFSLLFYVVTI